MCARGRAKLSAQWTPGGSSRGSKRGLGRKGDACNPLATYLRSGRSCAYAPSRFRRAARVCTCNRPEAGAQDSLFNWSIEDLNAWPGIKSVG